MAANVAAWLAAFWFLGWLPDPPAQAIGRGLTESMIRTALESAHLCITPGVCKMQLIDMHGGRGDWRNFRLDKFSIRVRGGHFVIEGDTTELN